MPHRLRVRQWCPHRNRQCSSALLIKDKAGLVVGRWVVRVDVRDRARARFADSQFSSAHGLQVRVVVAVARREAVRHLIVRGWITVAVRIPQVLAVRDSRHVQEWARDQVVVLRRACRRNRQAVPDRNRGVRDSAISTDLKKVR
jgi:hypothetical protein